MARPTGRASLGIVQEGTYERVVKPFGSTVKKVVRIEFESWGKNVGICSGSRGIRK